jgi:hypothetical protein
MKVPDFAHLTLFAVLKVTAFAEAEPVLLKNVERSPAA